MSRQQPPCCRTFGKFLQHHLGKDCLAPLTDQDRRALVAFVHLVDLYAVADFEGREHAISAMTSAVGAMQRHTRILAKKAIPHLMDWADEDRLWAEIAGLLAIDVRGEAATGGAA